MRLLFLLFALCVSAAAQTPELAGIVIDTNGQPIRKAELVLTPIRPDRPGEFQQSLGNYAEEDGTFEFYGVPTGSYRLVAKKGGYLHSLYGATNANSTGVALFVREGQPLADVRMVLTWHAVVSGRVVGPDGDAPGVTILSLMRIGYENGRAVLVRDGYARTTRTGDFRVTGVAAGRYYLRAEVQPAAGSQREPPAPTYFPGALSFEDAEVIEVATGGTVEDLYFPIRRSAAYTVSGVVRGAAAGVRVFMRTDSTELGAVYSGGSATTKADGTFQLTNILPGDYRLTALKEDPEAPLAGAVRLSVSADRTGISIDLEPPFEVRGSVAFAEGITPSRQVYASLVRPNGDGVYGSRIESSGEFVIPNVLAESYHLQIGGVPVGAYVRSATYGGEDALSAPVEITSSAEFRIELGRATGQIVGFAQDEEAAPVKAVLTLVPDPPQPLRSDLYFVTDALENGAFRFIGVPPGPYRLYAWQGLEHDAYFDPEFTARHADEAAELELSDGELLQTTVVRINAGENP